MHKPEDVSPFCALLAQLVECYPGSKPNLEIIAPLYFEDLAHLPITDVAALFTTARRTCSFFPTIAELLKLAGGPPEAACSKCSNGHGHHTGHKVKHFPAGPWCDTCHMDMPMPPVYNYIAPASAEPLSPSDVQAMLRGVNGQLVHIGKKPLPREM